MYKKLAIAISINTVLMLLITYANLADAGHFFLNINRIYMAVLMAAPMVVVMLAVMGAMYENKRLNAILIAAFSGLFVLTLALVRTQSAVGNEQFLRSMIPHHSSAILMCEQASITDGEISRLCEAIVQAQEEEIAQMKAILERLP